MFPDKIYTKMKENPVISKAPIRGVKLDQVRKHASGLGLEHRTIWWVQNGHTLSQPQLFHFPLATDAALTLRKTMMNS